MLLFPISWSEWQYSFYRSDDYVVTVIAILGALLVYGIYWLAAKRRKPRHTS